MFNIFDRYVFFYQEETVSAVTKYSQSQLDNNSPDPASKSQSLRQQALQTMKYQFNSLLAKIYTHANLKLFLFNKKLHIQSHVYT